MQTIIGWKFDKCWSIIDQLSGLINADVVSNLLRIIKVFLRLVQHWVRFCPFFMFGWHILFKSVHSFDTL